MASELYKLAATKRTPLLGGDGVVDTGGEVDSRADVEGTGGSSEGARRGKMIKAKAKLMAGVNGSFCWLKVTFPSREVMPATE